MTREWQPASHLWKPPGKCSLYLKKKEKKILHRTLPLRMFAPRIAYLFFIFTDKFFLFKERGIVKSPIFRHPWQNIKRMAFHVSAKHRIFNDVCTELFKVWSNDSTSLHHPGHFETFKWLLPLIFSWESRRSKIRGNILIKRGKQLLTVISEVLFWPPKWGRFGFGANLALYFKAIIALFTGAGPAPKGQIGSHCGLLRLSMGLVLSQLWLK